MMKKKNRDSVIEETICLVALTILFYIDNSYEIYDAFSKAILLLTAYKIFISKYVNNL